jgi:F420-non-reducing hydrogenase large subunit
MPTLTFPLSRIEGHARVEIEVQRGKVISARFQATELRGFDYFVHGIPAQQMPVITPRICGVCSTAHHVASVKTLEDAYGVTPPPLALKIRELLMLGQLVQNQATSLFIFTMPDRMGLPSIFNLDTGQMDDQTYEGQTVDLSDEDQEALAGVAARALMVRKVGTDLITLAGGQFIHPVKAVVGGVTTGIPAECASDMRERLAEALPIACELFDYYWTASLAMGERLGTWGDDTPACYIASLGSAGGLCSASGLGRAGDIIASRPNYYGDAVSLLGCGTAEVCASFPARDFRRYLTYEETDYSYAPQTSYQGRIMRANSLARVNMIGSLATPRADEYLTRFHEAFGRPAHAIMLFDLARGVELVYALERAMEILDEPLDEGELAVPYTHHDGEGYGLVEAPRGPLIHHYVIEDGRIADAEFIIPTVHNARAIEHALRVAAKRYVSADRVDMELERAVGRVVRAFDPCIACATH